MFSKARSKSPVPKSPEKRNVTGIGSSISVNAATYGRTKSASSNLTTGAICVNATRPSVTPLTFPSARLTVRPPRTDSTWSRSTIETSRSRNTIFRSPTSSRASTRSGARPRITGWSSVTFSAGRSGISGSTQPAVSPWDSGIRRKFAPTTSISCRR